MVTQPSKGSRLIVAALEAFNSEALRQQEFSRKSISSLFRIPWNGTPKDFCSRQTPVSVKKHMSKLMCKGCPATRISLSVLALNVH